MFYIDKSSGTIIFFICFKGRFFAQEAMFSIILLSGVVFLAVCWRTCNKTTLRNNIRAHRSNTQSDA